MQPGGLLSRRGGWVCLVDWFWVAENPVSRCWCSVPSAIRVPDPAAQRVAFG
jgi:hypothetical protein